MVFAVPGKNLLWEGTAKRCTKRETLQKKTVNPQVRLAAMSSLQQLTFST